MTGRNSGGPSAREGASPSPGPRGGRHGPRARWPGNGRRGRTPCRRSRRGSPGRDPGARGASPHPTAGSGPANCRRPGSGRRASRPGTGRRNRRPPIAASGRPLERSQLLNHPLHPPAAKVRPSGAMARQVHPPSPCDDQRTRGSQVDVSQIRMVPSHPAATSVRPSGVNARAEASQDSGASRSVRPPVLVSHSTTPLPGIHAARVRPSGARAHRA